MDQKEQCQVKRWDLLKQQLNNLCPEEFRRRLKENPQAILIDVRTPQEFGQEALPGARNMDFLGMRYWDIFESLDKEAPTFVYCRTGRRSVRTAMFMHNGGFREVYNLDGGLVAWKTVFEDLSFIR